MEKLALKHIVGYLPYGLKILNGWGDIKTLTCFYLNDEDNGVFFKIKPILRPLSDITKEIEVNGEKFVPIDFLEGMFGDCSKLTDTMLVNSFVPYGIVKKLYEWHFDIHDLISKGLAIDINTLKP